MAKLESTFKNMLVVLVVVALVSSFLLATVYNFTKQPIQEARIAKQENAIKEVLPEFDKLGDVESVNDLNVYKAYKGNNFVGAAVEASSPNGFSGEIRIMVGFDKDGRIYNYVVLEQKETPGLGTKIVDWFKSDKGNRSVIMKDPGKETLRVKKDGGTIDAITASTVSSRAFLQAVMSAYQAYANNPDAPDAYTDASSGATQAVPDAKPDTISTTQPDVKTGAGNQTVPVTNIVPDAVTDATSQASSQTTSNPVVTPPVTKPVNTPVKTTVKKEEKALSGIDSILQKKQEMIEKAREQREAEEKSGSPAQ